MSDVNGSFNLKIEGLDQLASKLDMIGSNFTPVLQQAMVNVCTLIQNSAKEIKSGSFKNRTGNLRRSIQTKDITATRGVVYTDQTYAGYVEFGTNAHMI